MKKYKVLAITTECEEIQKIFDSRVEAEQFTTSCEAHDCFGVHIAEIDA